jgi:ER-bound oxygenase mpaB/B'/Rubber oxygenase, catalytic domain
MATRWSDDAFLDEIRRHVDDRADACVTRLFAEGGAESTAALFRHLTSNRDRLPDSAPEALRVFFAETRQLPPGVDLARVGHGEETWMRHAFPAALVLLAKSLPEGYAAPSFGQILSLSGDLERRPYRRLLGVLQMVMNVSSPGGFGETGKAITTAQKMRLLHAGIRAHLIPRLQPPFDAARFGPPINLEDMLATLMGFSYLVIDGLRILGAALKPDEEEDLYYLWRVFAQVVGIHPPGHPESGEWVPANVTEAAEFYAAFKRRHYVGPAQNPKGVVLARDNLRMLQDLLPRAWRLVGLGLAPRLYMWDLIGPEGCARVGITPVLGHRVLKAILLTVVRLSHRVIDDVPVRADDTLSRLLFQGMINRSWDGQVTFLIPDTLADLRKLA